MWKTQKNQCLWTSSTAIETPSLGITMPERNKYSLANHTSQKKPMPVDVPDAENPEEPMHVDQPRAEDPLAIDLAYPTPDRHPEDTVHRLTRGRIPTTQETSANRCILSPIKVTTVAAADRYRSQRFIYQRRVCPTPRHSSSTKPTPAVFD
jgi:hypothetical protein